MKIVINQCFGGFGLSAHAMIAYLKKKEIKIKIESDKQGNSSFYHDNSKEEKEYIWDIDIERNDPALVEVIEELGEKANGKYSDLKIVEIPDNVEWHIAEYDGREHVAQNHQTWY